MNKKELEDKLLEDVSGGKLIENEIEEMLSLFVPIYKDLGLTKANFIEAFKAEWKGNSSRYSTNSSAEDLEKILQKIENEYDSIYWPEEKE